MVLFWKWLRRALILAYCLSMIWLVPPIVYAWFRGWSFNHEIVIFLVVTHIAYYFLDPLAILRALAKGEEIGKTNSGEQAEPNSNFIVSSSGTCNTGLDLLPSSDPVYNWRSWMD